MVTDQKLDVGMRFTLQAVLDGRGGYMIEKYVSVVLDTPMCFSSKTYRINSTRQFDTSKLTTNDLQLTCSLGLVYVKW